MYRQLRRYPISVHVQSCISTVNLFLVIFWSCINSKSVDIVHIYAQRIGHHIYNHEMYKAYALQYCSKTRQTIFLYTQPPVNQFIASFLQECNPNFSYFLVPSFPSVVLKLLASLQKFVKLQIVPWETIHPRNHIASIQLPPYVLQPNHKNLLSSAKSRLHISLNPFISIHNRDSLFLQAESINDLNYHDYRDYNIDDLSLLVNHLHSLNISAIRHGDIQKHSTSKLFPESFVDLTNKDNKLRSDDILLVADSMFFVGCSTGFSMVPFLFRKPTLLIQYVPFRLDELCIFPANTLVIPKLLRDVDSGRLLTFTEIASLNYNIHSTTCPFESLGLEIVNNTPQEILDAALQMLNIVLGKHVSSQDDHELQELFWDSVSHLPGSTACRTVNISIPNSFLAKYSFLLS